MHRVPTPTVVPRSLEAQPLTVLAVQTQMVMVYPMPMDCGMFRKVQMPSAMMQHNPKIKMETDTVTTQAAICLMHVLPNLETHGKTVPSVARMLIKMAGQTFKILIQMISRNGPMLMVMGTVTIQVEPHLMLVPVQAEIQQKATAMDAWILMETAGMNSLTSYQT